MRALLDVPIRPQPDDTTCGPTCLEAVYAYYGRHADPPALIHQAERQWGRDAGRLRGGRLLRAVVPPLVARLLRWVVEGLESIGLRSA